MFQNGVNYDLAVEHHSRMKRAKELVAKKNLNKVKKGGVVMARRKWRPDSQWGRGNMKQTWFPAEIIKVRTNSDGSESYDVSRCETEHCFFMSNKEWCLFYHFIVR